MRRTIVAGLLLMASQASAAVYTPDHSVGCEIFQRGASTRSFFAFLGWDKPRGKLKQAHIYLCAAMRTGRRGDLIGQILTPDGVALCDVTGAFEDDGCFTLAACGAAPVKIC